LKVRQLTYSPGEDPKEVALAALGSKLDTMPDLYSSRVLVITAPSMDRIGSILTTAKEQQEGRYQSKAGLLIKVGPDAFKYDPRYPQYPWEGPAPEVGDWVLYRTSDAHEIGFAGLSCRLIWDSEIVGRITDIEAVY